MAFCFEEVQELVLYFPFIAVCCQREVIIDATIVDAFSLSGILSGFCVTHADMESAHGAPIGISGSLSAGMVAALKTACPAHVVLYC
jgi:hypothetical protein